MNNKNAYQHQYGSTYALKPPAGRHFLLAIAIDDYKHCPRLMNCEKDANDIIAALVERYQFEEEYITRLFSGNASRERICEAFRQLALKLQPWDSLLIYFSGHGEFNEVIHEGYWIPCEAHCNEYDQYIAYSWILKALKTIRCRHTFLMVDASFSDALFLRTGEDIGHRVDGAYSHRWLQPMNNRKLPTTVYSWMLIAWSAIKRGCSWIIDTLFLGKGMGIDTTRYSRSAPSRWGLSSGRQQVVSNGKSGDNSPFAIALLNYLRNSNIDIDVAELCAYVTAQVKADTAGHQEPIAGSLNVEDNQKGQYCFRIQPHISAWAAALAENTIAGYLQYHAQFPKGEHRAKVLKHIKSLSELENAWLDPQPGSPLSPPPPD